MKFCIFQNVHVDIIFMHDVKVGEQAIFNIRSMHKKLEKVTEMRIVYCSVLKICLLFRFVVKHVPTKVAHLYALGMY